MKRKSTCKMAILAVVAALILVVCNTTATAYAATDKPSFDTETIIYQSKTVVYNGMDHYIEVGNLPAGALVRFNTYVSEPGVYNATAIIYVGDKYAESEVSVHATLTILATELKSGKEGSLFIDAGVDPAVSYSVTTTDEYNFSDKVGRENTVYGQYKVSLTMNGADYALDDGAYKMKVHMPIGKGYTDMKIFVKDAEGIKEASYRLEGEYAVISVSESVQGYAVTYGGKVKLYGVVEADFTWLIVLLGVVSAAEITAIVFLVLKLRKLNKL